MKLPIRYVGFFAWIAATFALAYGSISFMLFEPNIASWTFLARLWLLVAWGWLSYVPTLVKKPIRFLGILALSSLIFYVLFSFLLFNTTLAEWSGSIRSFFVALTLWLAFSLSFYFERNSFDIFREAPPTFFIILGPI